jgi:hypothetical protein
LGFNLASEKAPQSPDGMVHKLPTIQPLYLDDDSEFIVQLNGGAMARYIAGPSAGFNSESFHAHLTAFVACVKILKTPVDASGIPTPEGILQKYAAENWITHLHYLHFVDIEFSCATDADVVVLAETLLGFYADGKVAAENLFRQEGECCDRIRDYQREGDFIMNRWYSRYNPAYTFDTAHTSNETLAESLTHPGQFFVPFVKWHAEIMVEQVTYDLIVNAFRQVYLAFWTVSLTARPQLRQSLTSYIPSLVKTVKTQKIITRKRPKRF